MALLLLPPPPQNNEDYWNKLNSQDQIIMKFIISTT